MQRSGVTALRNVFELVFEIGFDNVGECPPEIGEKISGKLRATDPVELQGSLKRVPFLNRG